MLVKENIIALGEYMILKFNFSKVKCTQDLNAADERLSMNIIWSLEKFNKNYLIYLAGEVQELISENINDYNEVSSLRKLVSCASYTLLETKGRRDTKHPRARIKEVSHESYLLLA